MLSARDALVRRGQFALRGDFEVRTGEFHALVGRNGAGKTTWLRLLAGQLRQSEGEIECGGRSVRPPLVAYLPARSEDAALGASRLAEVELTLGLLGDPQDAAARLAEIERLLDLPQERPEGRSEVFFRALSGLTAMRPEAILLDEPTSRLDPASRQVAYRALRRLADAGAAVLAATHDPGLARRADCLWLVAEGTLARVSLEEAVASGALRAPEISAALPALPLASDASAALRALLRP